MSATNPLWVFVSATVVGVILTIAFAASMVIQQRRYLSATRDLSGRLLAAQEEERAWVARELHDDLIQRVAMLGHELEQIEHAGPMPADESARRLGGIRADLHDLAEEIRRLAHRMHPAVLDHLGLPAALVTLAAELASGGLDVGVDTNVTNEGIPADVATCLYRVAQEALRNAAKHAGVSTAVVRLHAEAGGLLLEVEDGGAGFDTASPAAHTGLGLTSLAERVRLLQGRLTIRTKPGQGTRICAWVPIDGTPAADAMIGGANGAGYAYGSSGPNA